jgi:hypothetical protein
MTRNPNPRSQCPPALDEGVKNQWDFLSCRTNGRKECCFELHVPDEVWRERRETLMEVGVAPLPMPNPVNADDKKANFSKTL